MNKHLLRGFGTFLTLCLIFFTGCELFNNKPEGDLENKIDEAVDIANAPVVNVEVANPMGGTVVPAGTLTGIKQGVPFKLNFSVNPSFGFVRWAAFLEGEELGQDQVEFSAPTQLETMVTVHINPGSGKIVLEARSERLTVAQLVGSVILSAEQDSGTGEFNGTPQFIQLRFDKPMDPFSFVFPDRTAFKEEASIDSEGNHIVRFNNITLVGMTEHNPYDEIPLGAYFNPPVLSADGKLLTLWVKEKMEWPNYFPYFFGYSLRIILNLDARVRDKSGLPLERDYVFNLEYSRTTPLPSYIVPETVGAVNGLGTAWSSHDKMQDKDYRGQNYMIIKAGSSGNFPGNFSFDPTHNVFATQGEWVYIAMLINYAVSMPRAFMILETDGIPSDSGVTWYYSGTEAEIVQDPNITIPITREFEKLLSMNGREKDKVYPVMVLKYKLKNWNYTSGPRKTVLLRCAPLNIATAPAGSPRTYGYWDVPTPDGNPGRYQIHYDIP